MRCNGPTDVIPGWCASTRPGISRFRVRCFASPRNDKPSLLPARQQCCIAACRCGINGYRLFGGKAQQIMRSARLGAGAGQAVATEWLDADNRADHVAVDIDVADLKGVDHI